MVRKRVLHCTIEGVAVKLQRRPDGGLRLYSDDLPGLVLSGKDWWDILADAAPAIKILQSWPIVPPGNRGSVSHRKFASAVNYGCTRSRGTATKYHPGDQTTGRG